MNVPVFSLKTETSGGIGEYLDLIPLIDWAHDNHLNVIQILPINDSGLDSSPYNLHSAFALNPLYIKWAGLDPKGLNDLPHIDYAKVRELKKNELKKWLPPFEEIERFVFENPWVVEYAENKEGEISIHEQYLCYSQMKQVKKHADEKGVLLMGDVPILVAKDSYDVKVHPKFFLKNLSAGAPPDAFSPTGQNWGFPLYNWEELEKNDYRWWKSRLKLAEEFYHLFRIDHIVGFYRIWGYQNHHDLHGGSFYPPNEQEWVHHGENILHHLLSSTTMLPIGEDLGTIPDEVRTSMKKMHIPGTKVMRWERKWHQGGILIPFDEYPECSLTTVSTHDSEPLRLWWQKCHNEALDFCDQLNWPHEPQLSNEKLIEMLRFSHQTPSRYHINLLGEYLSAVDHLNLGDPDWDRINRPGTVSDLNWAWRMKPTINEMAHSKELSELIAYCLVKK